jgi:hypothetical protein
MLKCRFFLRPGVDSGPCRSTFKQEVLKTIQAYLLMSNWLSIYMMCAGKQRCGKLRAGFETLTEDTMKYMLLIYADEQIWTEAEREQCYKDSTDFAHQLNSKGQYLAANPLQSVSTATSVQMRDGKRLVIDGPFAETREQLGGYFLIEAKDLDEAIGIAARIPAARKGTVEIRPVMEVAGLPMAA